MPPLFEPPKPSSPSPATNADTDSIDGDIAKTGSAYVKAAHFPAETPTRIFRVVSMERETFQDRDTRESYERPVLYGMFAGTTEELGLSILQRSHALTSVETGGLWSIGPSRDGLQRSHALTSVET